MVGDEHDLAVGYTLEVLAVRALAVTLRGLHELLARDPTVLEGDLLHERGRRTLQQYKRKASRTRYLESIMFLLHPY